MTLRNQIVPKRASPRTCHHMLETLTEEIPQIRAEALKRRCAIATTIHVIHRNLPFIH